MIDNEKFSEMLSAWKDKKDKECGKKSQIKKTKKAIESRARQIVNYYYFYIKDIFRPHQKIPSKAVINLIGDAEKYEVEANSQTLAIVLHAYYFDIFVSIMEKIASVNIVYKLYISTHGAIYSQVNEYLVANNINATVACYENLGRDIYPFIKIMKLIGENKHQYVLKLHTKKTPHRFERGTIWREKMLAELLDEDNLKSALFCLKNFPIGIIGPTEYLYKISNKVGPNESALKKLSRRVNIKCDIDKQFFVGGTMFFLTVKAMAPVMELCLLDNEFQPEPIPIDGTMAHAIERFFGIACSSQDLEVVDINFARDLIK
jgi:lipopolysaccharide biosynthesis protein